MDNRPEFLVTLGLMPPCTPEDVKQAFFARARTAHPDHGGDAADFRRLQEAYDKAIEYTAFLASRTRWLSSSIDRYLQQQHLLGELAAYAAEVEVAPIEWLRREIGDDFAQLHEVVVGVRLQGPSVTNATLDILVAARDVLTGLRKLELIDTQIDDGGLDGVSAFANLERLILDGTPVSGSGLAVLDRLPQLAYLSVRRTGVSRFTAWRLRRRHRSLVVAR